MKEFKASIEAAMHYGVRNFFLATDDMTARQEFHTLVVETLRGKLVFQQVEISRNNLKAQRDGIVDFLLLGYCSWIIGTNGSSFSDQAALLTREKRKDSIGPNIFITCCEEHARACSFAPLIQQQSALYNKNVEIIDGKPDIHPTAALSSPQPIMWLPQNKQPQFHHPT